MSRRYCLVSDGDGRTWLCPVERRREAIAQIEAVEAFWSSAMPGHPPEGDEPAAPDDLDWLRRVWAGGVGAGPAAGLLVGAVIPEEEADEAAYQSSLALQRRQEELITEDFLALASFEEAASLPPESSSRISTLERQLLA